LDELKITFDKLCSLCALGRHPRERIPLVPIIYMIR